MLVESICWWYHLGDNLLLYKYKFTEYFGGLLQSVFAVPALIMRIARCLEVIMAVAVVSWWLYLHIALHQLAQLLLSLSTSWAKVMLQADKEDKRDKEDKEDKEDEEDNEYKARKTRRMRRAE